VPRKNGFRFLTVGSLGEKKGHKDLINAFAATFPDRSDVKLEIVGGGPLRGELLALSERTGVGDRVTLSGELVRLDVVSRMQACDAFVLSSHHETFGVVLAEAMACGKPCVATVCGGPEHIINDRNGILVPSGNQASLATAMSTMIETIDDYDGAAIRAECLSRYGADRLVERLEDLYCEALERGIPG